MIIDGHVHMVGNGSSGSGCRLFVHRLQHRLMARGMLANLGLSQRLLTGDLDQAYVELLLRFVRQSSVDRIVILAMDYVYNPDGRRREDLGSFFVPNDYVLKLAREYPKEFIPAVSIHPARKDALDELERCLALGARVLKILPNCHNIDCNDKRFEKFWKRMAEAKMPLIAHTGGELSVPVVNKAFASPRILTLPLECGVNVVAAHCGTNSLVFDRDYTAEFAKMLSQYSNLYGDSSALTMPLRSMNLDRVVRPEIRSRVLHGSDLPIPVSPFWVFCRGMISAADFKRLRPVKNPIELDYQVKRALGFGEDSFGGWAKLLGLESS